MDKKDSLILLFVSVEVGFLGAFFANYLWWLLSTSPFTVWRYHIIGGISFIGFLTMFFGIYFLMKKKE
ncbi:hypothetical protein HY643_03745 [Candidatus Woesearchaeota archaeon]|nr:hypothetical protein [Candidatus Woesearchaeota archaeon]